MAIPRVLIIRAPGTNCDFETDYAFSQAGASTRLAHINDLIDKRLTVSQFQVLVFPGGFTYGDDLGAGKIMGNEIRLKLGEDMDNFVSRGGLIMGICNGFQVMVKAGILPGGGQTVTLTGNDSGRFECRWIHLQANPKSNCVFTRGIERLYLPVANGEGKLVAGSATLDHLNIALYYCDADGHRPAGYPGNPSGSLGDIAGISDATGRIFALMPHPERHFKPHHHPRWPRGEAASPGDGYKIFANAVDWVKSL
ncbi:MAG: phosphoribosylformylglycinamidine synthase I [Dehalococcoidaceae bacterium]|nr:phosphoribosylformylglycinamidine synthase I [Dehalococcoidaceae bacterium]